MDFTNAIILSIVEGITEFLPISSTGHLVLTSNLLGIKQTEFVKSFEIIIQLGAILAIIALYWKTLTSNFKVWKNILIAFIPTAIIGFTLYNLIKQYLIGNPYITLSALFIGGIVLIILEKLYKEKSTHQEHIDNLPVKTCLGIGLIQAISIIPGVSRSGASIMGGLFLGLKRKVAVEFSFFLATPTMMAATSLDLIKVDFAFSLEEYLLLLVGFIGSFVTALVVVKWFVSFVQKYSFITFGIYRIVLSVIYYFFFLT